MVDNDNDEAGDEPKLKKKSFMDDDDDYFSSMHPTNPGEKTKEEKDKENAEMFRKIAEEEGETATLSRVESRISKLIAI